jgi:hypothetical protein
MKKSKKFIRIDGYCRACGRDNKLGCKYKFSILSKPEKNDTHINVMVERSGEHIHEIKLQKRGTSHEEMLDLITKSQGSSKAAKIKMHGEGMNDIPSQDVLRKIKSENNYKFEKQLQKQIGENQFESDKLDWFARLKLTSQIINNLTVSDKLKEKKIKGYVQSIDDFDGFHFITFIQEQLEIIHKVKPEDRIMHFDSTGGLVKINSR